MKKTKLNPIPSEVYRISEMTQAIVKGAPQGTNVALYRGLMTMMSGEMLGSRGALMPALDSAGFDRGESMRIWQGLAHGAWKINDLLEELGQQIASQNRWLAAEVGGYRVKALDTVGYFRPRLRGCVTKHYNSAADKALPAINLGQLAMVGRVGEQNVTIPCVIVRAAAAGQIQSEEDLMKALCKQAAQHESEQDVVTADRKFSPLIVVDSGCANVVLRRPKNMTLRRSMPPPYSGRGRRPVYGDLVRPLSRRRKEHVIPASAPDDTAAWHEQQTDGTVITITAKLWHKVVPTQQKTWTLDDRKLMTDTAWTAIVIEHPKFDEPLVVLTTVPLSSEQTYQVVRSRWGVEQPPLVAKQLLGFHRQFVWADQMRFRYPELSLLAAGILTYVASTVQVPTPASWWDRHPKPTAGRLRRLLLKVDWHQLPLDPRLRVKRSVTAHLPVGRSSLLPSPHIRAFNI